MSASDASAMDTSREEEAVGSEDEQEEIRVLMAQTGADLYEGEQAVTNVEVDDDAISRRTHAIVRRRSSGEMSDGDDKGVTPEAAPIPPPTRFVRRGRALVRARPQGEGEGERPATPHESGEEPRSLIVSSLYPSFRTSGAPVRTVRWGRKRKVEPGWEGGRRSAAYGHAGPAASHGRARRLEGSVAYI
jgi:hypothetical protein